MKNPKKNTERKLISWLSLLDQTEMKRLRNFLRSPYHNRSQLLIDLFEYYYRRYPDFAGVDDETLFRKAIPDRVFDPVYLNNRLSDLDKLVEQFLMVEEIKERPLAVWRAVLQKRGCMDLYAKEVFSELDRVDREPTLSWRTLHSRWLLHQELFSSKVDLPVEQANLVVAGLFEHADEHFLLARLSYACEMRSRGTAPEDPLFELVLEKANQRAGEQPLFDLYLRLYDLLSSARSESLGAVVDRYFDLYPRLGWFERVFFLLKMSQLSFRKMLSEGEAYGDYCFRLYRLGVEEELLSTPHSIDANTFLNVVVCGSFTRQFDWTAGFIESFQTRLSSKTRDATTGLSWAYYFFYQRRYDECMEHLSAITSRRGEIQIRAYSLYCRALFELCSRDRSYQETLQAYMGNFRSFLYRREKRSSVKLSYLHFLEVLDQMVDNLAIRGAAAAALAERLAALQPIANPAWVNEKLERLRTGSPLQAPGRRRT